MAVFYARIQDCKKRMYINYLYLGRYTEGFLLPTY